MSGKVQRGTEADDRCPNCPMKRTQCVCGRRNTGAASRAPGYLAVAGDQPGTGGGSEPRSGYENVSGETTPNPAYVPTLEHEYAVPVARGSAAGGPQPGPEPELDGYGYVSGSGAPAPSTPPAGAWLLPARSGETG